MSAVQNKSLIHDCIWVLPAVYARYVCTIIIARELLIVLKVGFFLLVCKAIALYVCFWGALLFILKQTLQFKIKLAKLISTHSGWVSGSHCTHMTVTWLPLQECVENALIAMVYEFQSTLAPALIAMIQAVQATNDSAGFQAIRLKEAG